MPSDRDNVDSSGGTTPDHDVAPSAVLVVDDDDALRALVVRWLKKAGLTCIEARSGADALDKAHAMSASLDAIVCDVMMPGLDGFEVVARLKADPATSAIPIVLLTAHASGEADIVRGVELGAVDHLAKPFSGPVLVAKVRAVCERARAARALVAKLRFRGGARDHRRSHGPLQPAALRRVSALRGVARAAASKAARGADVRHRSLQVHQRHVRSRGGRSRAEACRRAHADGASWRGHGVSLWRRGVRPAPSRV